MSDEPSMQGAFESTAPAAAAFRRIQTAAHTAADVWERHATVTDVVSNVHECAALGRCYREIFESIQELNKWWHMEEEGGGAATPGGDPTRDSKSGEGP